MDRVTLESRALICKNCYLFQLKINDLLNNDRLEELSAIIDDFRIYKKLSQDLPASPDSDIDGAAEIIV